MSGIRVSNLRGEAGSAPTFPDGAIVTGVTTSTSFAGNLTGDVTGNIVGDVTGNVTGNISGTTGSFTGNVSVGGTLTYEDVTNVDSVGVITARSGIKVGAGESISAVSGTITYYGDGSQLEGIQSGTNDFEGFDTGITAGKPVGLGSDGTVRAIKETGDPNPQAGSAYQFESGAATRFSPRGVVYDTQNDKIVITYCDYNDSSKGKCVVGEVNSTGDGISFGTPVEFNGTDTRYISSVFSPDNNKVVVFFANNAQSDYAQYNVGQCNGLSFGWSSSGVTNMYSNSIQWNALIYDSDQQKIVFIWSNQSNEIRSVTGDVQSNDTLNLGSTQGITSDNPATIGAIYYTSESKTVVVFANASQGHKLYYAVGTYTATNSQTWTTPSAFVNTGTNSEVTATYDSNVNRMVVVYKDSNNNNYGTAIVGSLSGTTMTWGTPVVFNAGDTEEISACFDSTNNKIVISYKDIGNSDYVTLIVGTIGGTDNRSISFGDEIQLNSATTSNTCVEFDPDKGRVVAVYNDGGTSGDGKARVIAAGGSSSTNLTSENYIGLAVAGISSGSTGSVTIPGGISSGHSGLTTARTYYVQPDGTLALTAGTPQVVAGTSISSTQILVR